MSSSISSSEAGRWRGFVRSALAAAGGLLAAFLLAALVLDPYDTGRTPFSLKDGVRPQGPRTAAASRGRDQSFAGAVFGNSHIQLVAPDSLREQTGIPFVSMIAPATGPKETLVLLDWWLRHRREPARAVVIGADQRWCTADPAMPNDKPFPFWLFAESFREYALGLIRYDLLEELWRRAGYLLRPGAPRARPDGYWDYEEGYRVQGYETDPRKRAELEIRADSGGGNVTGPFPAVEALRTLFARLGPDVPVVLVRPPVYRSLLPPPAAPTPVPTRPVARRSPPSPPAGPERPWSISRSTAPRRTTRISSSIAPITASRWHG